VIFLKRLKSRGKNIIILQFLDSFKRSVKLDRQTLIDTANTSLATKLNGSLAKQLAADVVDAVLSIRSPPPPEGEPLHILLRFLFIYLASCRLKGSMAQSY
jgi:hypothetical protein